MVLFVVWLSARLGLTLMPRARVKVAFLYIKSWVETQNPESSGRRSRGAGRSGNCDVRHVSPLAHVEAYRGVRAPSRFFHRSGRNRTLRVRFFSQVTG